jgi:hypothetical protein
VLKITGGIAQALRIVAGQTKHCVAGIADRAPNQGRLSMAMVNVQRRSLGWAMTDRAAL